MSLTSDTFVAQIEEFLRFSSTIGDDWSIKSTDKNLPYLEKRCVRSEPGDSEGYFAVYVYHVIYSHSYCVPVLYFNVYGQDGKPFSLEQIWERVPECYKSDFEEQKWSTVTQQDHPLFSFPCFMVHPCHTADLMKVPFRNYIATWLSFVGPLIGLKLSLKYADIGQEFCSNTKE